MSLTARDAHRQLALGFAKVEADEAIWEHGALVTSLSEEILSFGQLYCLIAILEGKRNDEVGQALGG